MHKLTCCLQVPPPLTPREVTPGSEKCLSFWGEAGEDAPAAAGGRGACGEGCPDWLSLQGSQQHASCQCPATAAPRQAGQGQVPNLPHWRPALATSRPVPRLSTFLRVFLPQNPAPDEVPPHLCVSLWHPLTPGEGQDVDWVDEPPARAPTTLGWDGAGCLVPSLRP